MFGRRILDDLWNDILHHCVPKRVLEGGKCYPGRHRDITIKGARGRIFYFHTIEEWHLVKYAMHNICDRKEPEDLVWFNESMNSLSSSYDGFTLPLKFFPTNERTEG